MFGLVVLLFLVPSVCSAYDDGDWQFWTEETIEGPLTDGCKASIAQEFKWGNDIGEFYDSETKLGLDFKVLDWLSIEPAYKHIYELKGEEWQREYRPMVSGTAKWKWADWKFAYRLRVAYRDKQTGDDVWRLRNRIKVNSPWKWTDWGINPYASDEIFSEEGQDSAIYRNRLKAGLGIGKLFMLEHMGGDLYLMWETSEKPDKWYDTYVIGANLKVQF